MTVELDQIDFLDLGVFERGEAHEAFRVLRREAPVHWNRPNTELKGFWSIVKYDDIKFVSSHPDLFSSASGINGPGLQRPDETPNATAQPGGVSIITMDPPRHVKVRRLVNRGFTPRAVNAMEPQIRAITVSLLEKLQDRDECDFVLDVASQLPLAVICGLMGIPEADWPLMFQLTNQTLGAGDPEYQAQAGVVPEEERGTVAASTRTALDGRLKMMDFFRIMLELRRQSPGEDLMSILLESEVDGERLDEVDILAFCFLLVLAGNETTRNAISGGLEVLCNNPDQRARLQSDMSLLDTAVEEILRWTSPLHHMSRRTMVDLEIRGQPIKRNDAVLMWYPSANRDEDVFSDPYRFDIARQPNDHLAFGYHEHFCLGAGFAKKEMRVMFEELFARYPNIQLEGPPVRLRSNFINGIKRMPVTLR
jgi:cytochrome P450